MPNNHLHSVVITRPKAQAAPLAARLAVSGYNVVILPLLEIHALDDVSFLQKTLQGLSDYALVAFVSPNAIDACFAHLSAWPRQVALAVMGEGSRAALAKYGVTDDNATIFSPVDPERTDSETLLDALDLPALQGRQILIVRGESGRELLGDALRVAGIEVVQLTAYRRSTPILTAALGRQLRGLLGASDQNDWIITSSEALRGLMKLLEELKDDKFVVNMQRQHLIVPHARIAETAKMLGFERITLTGSGDERLISALQLSV